MGTHTVDISDCTPHHAWDRALAPVTIVGDGDEVHATLREVTDDQLSPTSTSADLSELDLSRLYPLLGPVEVEGAEPGDTLEVEILSAIHRGWGFTAVLPGMGLLAEDFSDPYLHVWDLGEPSNTIARFGDVATVALRPFPGTVGACPDVATPAPIMPPGHFGGNIDCRDVVAGSRLFLPVQVPGAMLSIGDGHSAMGDGEVCVTAIESPLDVALRLRLHKDRSIPGPQLLVRGPLHPGAEDGEWYVTMGVGPDLMAAAKDATRALVDWTASRYAMEPVEAYVLASVAAHLRITEIVDAPNWVVSAYLPLGIFSRGRPMPGRLIA
ncbi:MAG: acetamidase/formamidase family protein [Actinomycetota bacterium]|nr:acetamidase/formamidase family protein [Actinomycetota bacterium]